MEGIREQLHLASINDRLGGSIEPDDMMYQMTPSVAPQPAPIDNDFGLTLTPLKESLPMPMPNLQDFPMAPSWEPVPTHNAPDFSMGPLWETDPVPMHNALDFAMKPSWETDPVPTHNAPDFAMEPLWEAHPVPMHKAPYVAMAPNVSSTMEYQWVPATTTTQQDTASALQQCTMDSMNPNLEVTTHLTLPGKMRVVECKFCGKTTQTDNYTYVDCSNPDCSCRICLLDNCFQGISTKHSGNFSTHQYKQHLIKADPYQCYSCKAPKYRGKSGVTSDSCIVCGINWCLVGNCTYEVHGPSAIRSHITTKHKQR